MGPRCGGRPAWPPRRRRVVGAIAGPSAVALVVAAITCSGAVSFLGFSAVRRTVDGPSATDRPAIPAVALAAEGPKGQGGVIPVVDDSDFDLGTNQAKPGTGADDKFTGNEPEDERTAPKKNFESLIKAADKFALKKERRKKKTKAISMSLEDDLMGRSIEDDLDIDIKEGMESRARAVPKLDTSLGGRLKAWIGETIQLVTNPTQFQFDFVVIFLFSASSLIAAAILAVSLGGVKLRGQVNTEERQLQLAQQPYFKRMQMQQANRQRFLQVDDIATLSNDVGTDSRVSQPLNFFKGQATSQSGDIMNSEVPETVEPETPTPPPPRDPIPDDQQNLIIRPRAPIWQGELPAPRKGTS